MSSWSLLAVFSKLRKNGYVERKLWDVGLSSEVRSRTFRRRRFGDGRFGDDDSAMGRFGDRRFGDKIIVWLDDSATDVSATGRFGDADSAMRRFGDRTFWRQDVSATPIRRCDISATHIHPPTPNNTQQTDTHEYPRLPKFLNRHSIFKEEHSDYIVWTPLSGGWVRILLTSTVNPESRIIATHPPPPPINFRIALTWRVSQIGSNIGQ